METFQTVGICIGSAALVLIAFLLFLIAGDLSMLRMRLITLVEILGGNRFENEKNDIVADKVWKTAVTRSQRAPVRKPPREKS